ncbi:MAG: UDP-N-acetylmuramoyl-tripeptide--D-alanyl-D-alanine ligase [Lachnospiraceae bacterium]|nr:UDP-N-acetylmuramoyl-tripeptide--D-alanyl-D-alanine ligase [Lachnospiraceae bacterium]
MKFFLHMFQLNGYKNKEYLSWLGKNKSRALFPLIYLLPAVLLIVPGENKVLTYVGIGLLILISFVLAINFNAFEKAATKKKLVYTARVKRLMICLILVPTIVATVIAVIHTDNFSVSDMSWTLMETIEVWTFACALLQIGMVVCNLINHPIEVSINNHYINDAKRMLKANPDLIIIGVTGSYGKTSVKYYLHTLLSDFFDVLITPESYNTPMGVVKTIRGSLTATNKIFICEMGARHVGDIKEICDIVHPKHGVITSIGPQHLETFFNMENIISTKYELADALPDDGMLFVNDANSYVHDERVKRQKEGKGLPGEVVLYSVRGSEGYRASNITLTQTGTEFTLTAPDGEVERFAMRLIGGHNVINVVGAIAVAHKMGVSLSKLRVPVRRIEPVAHRLQMRQHGNVTIIDDAYNSNPVGSKAAVETLNMFDGLRILVTPGMVELGEKEEEYNYKFGTYAAENCDHIVLVGKERTKPIAKGALDSGFSSDKLFAFDTLEEALQKAYTIPGEGHRYILLENDLPDNY